MALNVNIHHREIADPVTKRNSRDGITLIAYASQSQIARTPRVGRRTKPTPSMPEATDLDYRGCQEPDTSKHIIRMYSMMSRS